MRALPTALPALLALALVLSRTALARAQAEPEPARLFLDYERTSGARGCLDPPELTRAVEQRLGRAVFVAAADADILARVRAQRAAHGFRIDVELLDRERRSLGHRRLQTRARHCSALDDALALVLSLAADVSGPSVSTPPVPSSPPALTVLETPIEVPENTYAPRLGWHWRPRLGASALSGALPGIGWGLSAELELRPPNFWPLWLRATAWRSQSVAAGADRAEFSAQSVELGVCPWLVEWDRLESRACAEQMLGRVHAEGVGFDQDQPPGAEATLALGVSEALSYRFGDWFVSVSGSLLVPLIQRRYFYVDGTEITLHDQAWVWAMGTISLGLEL